MDLYCVMKQWIIKGIIPLSVKSDIGNNITNISNDTFILISIYTCNHYKLEIRLY